MACRSISAAALASLLLAGCVTMNEADCRNANWYDLGWRDGLGGLRPYINQYEHACEVSKVQVAEKAEKEYLVGWQHGKWEYDSRVHASDCCSP